MTTQNATESEQGTLVARVTAKEQTEMSDLGVLLYLHFLLVLLLVGNVVTQLFHVGVLDPVHQLYVLLQQQPLGEGPPRVWAVPVGIRRRRIMAVQCCRGSGRQN